MLVCRDVLEVDENSREIRFCDVTIHSIKNMDKNPVEAEKGSKVSRRDWPLSFKAEIHVEIIITPGMIARCIGSYEVCNKGLTVHYAP